MTAHSKKTIGRAAEWPKEQADALREMWGNGLSASKIAAKLNKTRNSVLGKVWRLKIARKPDSKCRMQKTPEGTLIQPAPRIPRLAVLTIQTRNLDHD